MRFSLLFKASLGAALVEGYLVAPPGPVLPGAISTCSAWALIVAGDSCSALATKFGITVAQIVKYNPLAGAACTLTPGFAYCVQDNFGASPVSSTLVTSTTSQAPVTTTALGNGIATPTPIQTGMTSNCNAFYLVQSGDQCGTIASSKGISLTDFYSWNPAAGTACESLWAQYYVCVGVIGSTTTPTTTSTGNGIATPTPIQPGMTGSCKKFHLVVSGDQCGNLATAAGISLADFYSWNPTVGNTCASLWLDYYVCVGI